MDWDIWKPALGAIVGFALAQTVNVGKIVWDAIRRPKLRIIRADGDTLLGYSSGGRKEEAWFGFRVRNVGQRVAVNVRCQIIKIEYLDRSETTFNVYATGSHDLYLYTGQSRDVSTREATIVPGAQVDILLAYYRGDEGVFEPAVTSALDHFDDLTTDAVEYRISVVAFDSSNRFVSEVIKIKPR